MKSIQDPVDSGMEHRSFKAAGRRNRWNFAGLAAIFLALAVSTVSAQQPDNGGEQFLNFVRPLAAVSYTHLTLPTILRV